MSDVDGQPKIMSCFSAPSRKFWKLLLLVIPLSLMIETQARGEDVPTPSGTYSVRFFDGTQVSSTFNCNSTECTFGGFGASVTISRTENFDLITRGWDPANRVLLGGGRIAVTGRFYGLNDPDYPQKTRVWIPSAIGSVSTGLFFDIAKQRLENRGAVLGANQGSEETHTTSLVLNWRATLMYFNLSWNSSDPRSGCTDRSPCDNIPFASFPIAAPAAALTSTSITSTTSTTTVVPTTNEVVETTTTIDESVTTVVEGETATTVEAVEPEADSVADISATDSAAGPETVPIDAEEVVVSAVRDVSVTPSGAASVVLLSVASVASIVAAGAAGAGAATAGAIGATSSGRAAHFGGPNEGTGRSIGVDEMSETGQREAKPDGTGARTAETSAAMFTTEQLGYGEQVKVSGVAMPTALQHSRIALRVFYDASLASAVSASLHRDPVRRPVPHLGRPLLITSLVAAGASSFAASLLTDADSAVGLAAFVTAGFVAGLVSAVHGTVFAFVAAAFGITGVSKLFESSEAAGGSSTASPLTISLLVVLCCFVPLLASTVAGSNSLGNRSRRQQFQLFGGCVVMFVIAVKVSQEITSQISGVSVGFGSPSVWIPAIVGSSIPIWRRWIETWLNRISLQTNGAALVDESHEDAAWRAEVARVLQLTAELRRGELLRPPHLRARLTGTFICSLVLGFIAYSYLHHAAAVALICLSFVLISSLHFPQIHDPERTWGELLIRGGVSRFRPIPSWATLLVPTVGAMLLGLVVAVLRIDAKTAIWMSVSFSYAVFFFELYDVCSAKSDEAFA